MSTQEPQKRPLRRLNRPDAESHQPQWRGLHAPLKNGIPNCQLSDRRTIRELVPDFDPALEFEYSERELLLLAEKILDTDRKPCTENPAFHFASRMLIDRKREIYVGNGTPEPHVASGMYWRTHPEGRKVRTKEERRASSASYYR